MTVGGKDAPVLLCDILLRCCGWEEREINAAASQKSSPKVLSLISFPPYPDTDYKEETLRSAKQPALMQKPVTTSRPRAAEAIANVSFPTGA